MNQQNKLVKEYMTESLLLLLEQKTYDTISVTDITKKAGVSRMAFYRNYKIKDDIIDEYFTDILAELTAHFDQTAHSHDENLMDFLELIHSSRNILRILISSNADYLITRNYEVILKRIILDHYKHYHPNHIPAGYQLDFLIGGLLRVILSWAKNDSEQDASALRNLFFNLEFFTQS